MDEFNTQPQHPENPQDPQDSNATSRRNFLKVAVVSSAAAAAAVGGAGVAASALASRTPTGLSKLLILPSVNLVSTANACFTHTSTDIGVQNSPSSPYNGTSSAFLFAWFTLPTHTSSDSFTLDFASDTPLTFLEFQNSNSTVDIWENQSSCPTSQPTGDEVSGSPLGPFPLTFSVDASVTTILVQLHLKGNSTAPSGTSTETVDVELKGPGGYDSISEATAYFSV